MRAYRNRTLLTIVDLFTALAIVTLLVTVQGFGQACNQMNNGCARSRPVPCANASCADSTFFPGGVTPNCDNGNPSTQYTATSALGWYNCQLVQPPQGGQCNDAMTVCLNAFLYSATPCNQANQCGQTTFSVCGYSVGPACN
jgi:hypothetical protein